MVFGHSNESLGSIPHRRVLRWCGACGCTPVRASVGPACCPTVSLQEQIKVLHSSHFLALQETFHEECDSLATYIYLVRLNFAEPKTYPLVTLPSPPTRAAMEPRTQQLFQKKIGNRKTLLCSSRRPKLPYHRIEAHASPWTVQKLLVLPCESSKN